MKRERKILKEFFQAIREGDERRFPNARIYRKLIFYRYEDALASTYPRFRSQLGEKRWNRLVHDYIASDIRTPYLWQMPRDFVAFAPIRFSKKRRRHLEELLWFEWIELELLMADCERKGQKSKGIDFSKAYRLGSCVRLRKLRYPVMYENEGEDRDKGRYPLLVYKGKDGAIHWQLLTPFLYRLLKDCDGKRALKKIVKKLAKRYRIPKKDALAVLEEPLTELLREGVLER